MKWLLDFILDFLSRLGAAEQKSADADAGVIVIQRANEAAKKVEEESGEYDANDRDNRS